MDGLPDVAVVGPTKGLTVLYHRPPDLSATKAEPGTLTVVPLLQGIQIKHF